MLRTELELAARPTRSIAELRDSIHHAAKEVDRLSDLANTLLELARAESGGTTGTPALVDTSTLIDEAVRAHRASADSSDIELIVDYPPGLTAPADPASLRRVLDSVISNALAYAPRRGTVLVSAKAMVADVADVADVAERGDASLDRIQITVRDTGPGMPDGFLPHAFERFSRSDTSRARRLREPGSGLGLAIVGAVMAAHGGTAAARNLPSGGLEITLLLPRSRAGTA